MIKNIFFLTILGLVFSCNLSQNTDKTLVAWVSLNAIKDRSGSVLTIQNGEQYDGIILSRENGGTWVAGSENNNRTQIEKGIAIQESDTLGEFVQLAIVYKGQEISMYQDGELKSRYQAENMHLLNHDKNFIIFGLPHVGGPARLSAAIEDARIYSQALSEIELKSLQPNEPSKVNPYAWWDFEGEEIIDKAGRFSFYNRYGVTSQRIKQTEGKLILDTWGYMIASAGYIPEVPEWPENPPEDWVTFHLAHPGQNLVGYQPGDPNPAYFYKGRYHLHYIIRDEYGFSYSHVSSKDMVRWKWHPTVLAPPITGHGMYSGTGFFTKEGQPAMIYHGVAEGNMVIRALDDNLDSWTTPEQVIARDDAGKPVDINYWDPDCWLMGDTYYALSGGKDPELMASDDLKNWKYLGKLLHDNYPDNLGVGRDEDISCANMFKIGNKWMLLCISHDLGCRYFLGDFKDGKYLPDFHATMNWGGGYSDIKKDKHGFLYFAPESMLSEDGRRVMWTWVIPDVSPVAVQSLPRELELPEDGILRIKPLKELESLRYDEWKMKDIIIKKSEGYKLDGVRGDAVELTFNLSAPLPNSFNINLLADESGKDGLNISFGAGQKSLKIGSIEPPFELKEGEDLNLRVFIDKNLVEVFANNRQAAVVANDHIRENPTISFTTEDADLIVDEIKAWKMKSIYQ
jgi:sucrose-6-phosphate hydrolase SacC (GH32 family)